MLTIPIPEDEEARLVDLAKYGELLGEPDAILDGVTSELARIFDVPTAAISFIDRDTQYYKAEVGIPEPFATTRIEPREESICSFVVGTNQSLMVEDLSADERFRESAAVTDCGLRFYAGAPLRAESGRALGSLCILDRKPRSISTRERELLRIIAEGVMAHVQLQATSRTLLDYTTQIDEELRRAIRVQQFLLPRQCVEESGWVIRHLYRPMAHLGGDFLDVIARPNGDIALIVADVTGHGTDAALTAAMIKTAFARAASDHSTASEILGWMNRELSPAIPPAKFISAISAILPAGGGAIDVGSAGHPPPLRVGSGSAGPIETACGLPLAVDREAEYEPGAPISLSNDERLVLFTDGAFEANASSEQGEQLGMKGLSQLSLESAPGDDGGYLTRLLNGICAFSGGELRDDVALMEIRRTS